MPLCGTLVSTLFHDVNDRLITGQQDGVVLITGKMLRVTIVAAHGFWY